jgi:hypothetical protein
MLLQLVFTIDVSTDLTHFSIITDIAVATNAASYIEHREQRPVTDYIKQYYQHFKFGSTHLFETYCAQFLYQHHDHHHSILCTLVLCLLPHSEMANFRFIMTRTAAEGGFCPKEYNHFLLQYS